MNSIASETKPALENKTSLDEPLLDKAGAAALLNVSVRTVEAWTAARRIPYVKLTPGPRGPIRFEAAALRQWISAQRVEASTATVKGE